MRERLQRGLERSFEVAWALVVLAFPITSLPLLIRLAGSNNVAAPSAVFLLWLLLVWLVPYLVRGGRLPRQTLILLAFASLAIVSSAAAFFREVPSFRYTSVISRETTALFTLAVGVSFYLVTAAWLNSERRLLATLRYLNWAGLAIILYTGVQAVYWLRTLSYPGFVVQFQEWFTPGPPFPGRTNAFAFEPSWLAHQLNIAFLPFWMAASVERVSAHRRRVLGVSFENVLLVGGVLALLSSLSRVGLLAFLAALGYLLILGNLYLAQRIQAWLARALKVGAARERWFRIGTTAGLLVVFFAAYVAAGTGLVYKLRGYDPRLERLFQAPSTGTSFYDYVNSLVFAERVVFWDAGWRTFNDHPLLGVGLGNAGYYFQQELPPFAWQLVEVNTLMYRQDVIPNTKALWTRLLAETGIAGFAIFLAWCAVLWQSAQYLRAKRAQCREDAAHTRLFRAIGLAGSLALVALLFEGFSVDTFALPYLWFTLGVVTAASTLAYHREGEALAAGAGQPPSITEA